MRSSVTTFALGLLSVGIVEPLPAIAEQFHLAQHIFGGSWSQGAQQPLGSVGRRCEEASGIGFELTTTYATASIRYRNGTMDDVGKIYGDYGYKNTMWSWWENSPPFEPPFLNPLNSLKWEYQQALRTLRKLRGLPATEDIGNIASMLHELKLATESKTGIPVTRAAIGIPDLPHLPKGDIEEAFNAVGITKLESPHHETKALRSLNTAYAGMGYGLCSDWKDLKGCKRQEMKMNSKSALVMSLNEDSLVITSVVMHAYINTHSRSWTFQGLGFQSRATPDYWKDVAERIVQVGRIETGPRARRIQQIVVMGERGEEREFLDSLWLALNSLADEFDNLDGRALDLYSTLQVSRFRALYLGARGAAELALRWQGEVQDCVDDFPKSHPVESKEEFPLPFIMITVAIGKSEAKGGAVDVMSHEEMEYWGVDTGLIGPALKQMKKDAGEMAWKIDAKKIPRRGVELSGTLYKGAPHKSEEPRLGRFQ